MYIYMYIYIYIYINIYIYMDVLASLSDQILEVSQSVTPGSTL